MSNRKGSVLPVFGWYWRDWRASTARGAMSPLARGIYRELLDAQYGEDDCALPDDDAKLAAMAGCDGPTWASVKAEVLPWLPLNKNGRRQNKRCLLAWKEARKFRKDRSKAGLRGAQERWHSHGGAMANDSPLPSHPTPHPLPPPTGSGVPSVGSHGGREAGRDGTEAGRLLLDAEANAKRQKPGPDGKTRTLGSGKSYLELLYVKGLAPDIGRRWLDEHPGQSNPPPGVLLRFVDPDAFAALEVEVARRLPTLRKPEAYVRSALADRWLSVVSRLRETPKPALRVVPL